MAATLAPGERELPGGRHDAHRFVPLDTAFASRAMLSAVAQPESLPSVAPVVPIRETLMVVGVTPTGAVLYDGQASHLGHVTAVLYPDNTFVKYAANGDTLTGFVTPITETTGTITYAGGTGRFEGATGLSTYVLSTDPKTGATRVDIAGTIAYGRTGHGGTTASASAAPATVQILPFKITGGGPAPNGMPLFPGGTVPHSATGTATQLGAYSGAGTFELGTLTISPTGAVSGTFQGTFVFVAANGDRLAMTYGDGFTGTFTGQLSADGTAVTGVTFDAIFTPDPANSTGRFADVVGGSFRMIAHADTVSLISDTPGYTAPFDYTWSGEGTLEYRHGQK
jgi:hypothetical protein